MKLLRWSQIGLWAAAVCLLGYCAFVLADTWNFQRQASQAFDRQLQPAAPPGPGADSTNGLLGRMEIPRLGMTMVVAEGTDETTLRRAGPHSRNGAPGPTRQRGHRWPSRHAVPSFAQYPAK